MKKNNKEDFKVRLIIWASMIAIFFGWVYLVWIQ